MPSILDLAASRNELAAASDYALAASLAASAATEVAREVFLAAIASANAALAAAQDADSNAWGESQDAALAAEKAEIALVAFALAEGHCADVANMGEQASPSDADEMFEGSTLRDALAEAGIDGAECEDQIEVLREMLRLAIREQLARDEAEREDCRAAIGEGAAL